MSHPFSGTNVQVEETPIQPTRRQALGTMVFAGAVAVPALVNAQNPATDAVNEAGGAPAPQQITTLALGEEGALTRALNEAGTRTLPPATTEPFGEEAGRVTSRVQPGLEDGANVKPVRPPVLTQAIPEEGRATTLAIGEEGGNKLPQATTEALNEEGNLPRKQIERLTEAVNEQGALPVAPMQAAVAVAVAQVAQDLPAQVQPVQPVPGVQIIQIQGGQVQGKIQIQIAPQVTTQALNEEAATGAVNEGGITTRAIGEEGAATKALNEAGINLGAVVAVPPMTRDLSEAQLKAVFADMAAADPGKALQACAVLYGSKQALTFLKANLKFETVKADTAAIAKLVKDLDSDEFDTREKAEQALEKLGMAALTALQAALDSKDTSMEVKMRAKRLVEKFKDNSPMLQAQRGVEVLIALNTPEAKELLEALAKGAENDLVVPVAKKALERIKK